MSVRADIRRALQTLVTTAIGITCGLGIPREVPTGDDTWIELGNGAAYDYDESGGRSVRAFSLAVVTVTTITGAKEAGDLIVLERTEARVDALKTAIEADTHLGGLVLDARIVSDRCEPVPASDNSWAAGARIDFEFDEW